MPLGFQVWAAVGVLLSLLAIVPVNGLKSDEARLNGQDVPYASAVADAAFLS